VTSRNQFLPHRLSTLANFWLEAGELYRERDSEAHAGSDAHEDHARRIMRESPPWIASGKLMNAYDGARAAATLWRGGEVHIIADYALLRVIVESAVLSWWVTSAFAPEERARRAYRIVVDDLTNAIRRERYAVEKATTEEGKSQRAGAQARASHRLEAAFAALKASDLDAPADYFKEGTLSMRSLLVEAERTIEGAGDLGYFLLWAIASTSAHGSLSAVEQLSLAGSDAGPVALSNPDTVFEFAAQAAHLLKAAHLSWNSYARGRG
jgi:hypothetical protein